MWHYLNPLSRSQHREKRCQLSFFFIFAIFICLLTTCGAIKEMSDSVGGIVSAELHHTQQKMPEQPQTKLLRSNNSCLLVDIINLVFLRGFCKFSEIWTDVQMYVRVLTKGQNLQALRGICITASIWLCPHPWRLQWKAMRSIFPPVIN